MPLPGDDMHVVVEVVVDVDVEPLGEGVEEEGGDGADPVREGGRSGRDTLVGDVQLNGAFHSSSGNTRLVPDPVWKGEAVVLSESRCRWGCLGMLGCVWGVRRGFGGQPCWWRLWAVSEISNPLQWYARS
eukprot:16119581-Heterocapsa_arctica.AAC.1